MALSSRDDRDDPSLRARYLVFVKVRNLIFHLNINEQITEEEEG
jgi:hypothetical protein